jgi:hypothetical protein
MFAMHSQDAQHFVESFADIPALAKKAAKRK